MAWVRTYYKMPKFVRSESIEMHNPQNYTKQEHVVIIITIVTKVDYYKYIHSASRYDKKKKLW